MKIILKSNLEIALSMAIKVEEAKGRGNSAFVEGLREVLSAMEKGEKVIIKTD